MPEAPELEVVKEFLRERAIGATVQAADIVKPSVLRSLAGDLPADIHGRAIEEVHRRGKFILIHLSGGRQVVVNPMLTGAIQYCSPRDRLLKRTCIVLSLSNGFELRYLDLRQMGIVYYIDVDQLDQVPRLNEQGPDVLDDFSFDDFKLSLRRFPGEIKGVLTRGRVISGIGNAYADEILLEAKVYPFRKRRALTPEELRRIYEKSREVVEDATPLLRERIGEDIHLKIRDFLKIHNKGGLPCPRCATAITELTANRRITSYCRQCQPGMLVRN